MIVNSVIPAQKEVAGVVLIENEVVKMVFTQKIHDNIEEDLNMDLRTLTDEELWLLQNKMVNFGLDFKDQPVTQRDHQSVMDEMFRREIINDRSLWLYQEGIQFAQQRDFRRATDKFREATKESPRFLTALNNLGAALLDLGSPQEALEVLRKGRDICLTLDLADNIDKAEAMIASRR